VSFSRFKGSQEAALEENWNFKNRKMDRANLGDDDNDSVPVGGVNARVPGRNLPEATGSVLL
jgi:hypothetical protein